MRHSRLFKTAILASTVLTTLSLGAHAQAQDAKTSDAPKADDQITEVVVTGTHIRRKDMNSASPVTTITAEDAVQNGNSDVADLLQKLPQAASTQQTNTLLGGYVVTGGSGVQTLSLYGLGAQNTLILLNGRRMGPAGIGGTVGPIDLNVLPLDAFRQVDIVLDGSSSIYGSEAVGGVVNFITKKNMDGFDFIVHGDVPTRSGGSSYTATIDGGKTFDKGFLSFIASYHNQTGLTVSQRKDTACAQQVYFDPTSGARSDYLDSNGNYKCLNLLNNSFQGYGFAGEFQYDPTHTRYPNVPAAGLASYLPDWVRAGRSGNLATYPYLNYDSPIYGAQTVYQPVRTFSLLVNGGYDLSSTASLYTELLYNRRVSENTGIYQLFPYVSPYNGSNTVAAGLMSVGGLGYARPIIAYANNTNADVDYLRGVVGVTGTLDKGFLSGFTYDANYQVSQSKAKYGQTFIYNDRVTATTDPTPDGSGCYQPDIIYSNAACMDIPWFSDNVLQGKFTPDQYNFLFGYEYGHTTYLQQTAEANISGDLFSLPAGAVSSVVGVFFESDQMNDTPGYNARNSNYWGFSTTGITKGAFTSEQAYAEFYVPLIKNKPLFRKLDLTMSGRYSNYSSAGSNGTYKLGLVWGITNSIGFTVTHGTSFRAPTIYEAHLANQTGFLDLNDPCTKWGESDNSRLQQRCAADGVPSDYAGALSSSLIYTGGGAGLNPETAINTNYGVSWTPSFADLKVTVNYNTIKDSNKIDHFGSQNIINACYGNQTFPNDYCTLFTRDPKTHDITVVHDNYINIATVENENVSLRIDYKKKFQFGRLQVYSSSSWQTKNAETIGENTVDYTGSVGNPVFTNQTNVNFSTGDWEYHWGMQMTGQASDRRFYNYSDVQPKTANYPNGYRILLSTPFYVLHSLAVTRRFDNFEMTVGVDNVFDKKAPTLSSGEFRIGTAALNMYDLYGRSVYFTLNKHF
ncbi:MAG: TonB-dependent receptor domain-containing protein [Asticcacaulis sp.]|uniref:TonB-dependent receptor domain-containing protein n=1 Tax=Asticcacaulis sp. TaxID=1872648 RepID=UPI003F7B6515